MMPGEVVYESGRRQDYVYFPTTLIVSQLYVMEGRHVGRDRRGGQGGNGVVGVSLFMGGETTPSRVIVQSAGAALRLSEQLLKREFPRAGPMQQLLRRYTQMAQTAVCNRHHRWINSSASGC